MTLTLSIDLVFKMSYRTSLVAFTPRKNTTLVLQWFFVVWMYCLIQNPNVEYWRTYRKDISYYKRLMHLDTLVPKQWSSTLPLLKVLLGQRSIKTLTKLFVLAFPVNDTILVAMDSIPSNLWRLIGLGIISALISKTCHCQSLET